MLKIVNLHKETPHRSILNNINIQVKTGEFVVLLGPSGSGKTALLRILAGLEQPTSGSILLRGEDITKKPPFARKTNMIFNPATLFPNLSVSENISFGLNFTDLKPIEKDIIVKQAIDLFEMQNIADAHIAELDSIQNYKVALARALVLNPDILLLDDALSMIDNKYRHSMRYELRRLQKELNKTFIYISNDTADVFAMADKLGVMRNGYLLQFDTPRNIYEHPKNLFVAEYIGNMNTFYARILEKNDNVFKLDLDNNTIILFASDYTQEEIKNISNRNMFFTIRPERMHLQLTPSENPEHNSIVGKILQKDYNAEHTQYYIQTEWDKIIVVAEPNYSIERLETMNTLFHIGDIVCIEWNMLAGNLVNA